ncbi:hypothetical protein [Streptomyces sp. NPDC052042]|uniref:hypothetical protein n=1 Tax=Streptomyces sp. NPDC052042 TaxID=3365683 RepID=UPI0037D8067A
MALYEGPGPDPGPNSHADVEEARRAETTARGSALVRAALRTDRSELLVTIST